jgi:hypothetical protein
VSIEAYRQGLEAELKRQLEPTVNGIKNTGFYYKTPEYAEKVKPMKERIDNAGKEGFNEYGVPLHACNGYIQNAHYWAWIGEKNRLKPLDWLAPRRVNDIRV